MTTPELTIAEQMQITKWEILANRYYQSDDSVYEGDDAEHCYKMGYLRAKRETEQAIKDARKQALEEAIAICESTAYAVATIKELLND